MFTFGDKHFFIGLLIGLHECHHLIWFQFLAMVVKSGHLFFDDGDGIKFLLPMEGADDTKNARNGEEAFH